MKHESLQKNSKQMLLPDGSGQSTDFIPASAIETTETIDVPGRSAETRERRRELIRAVLAYIREHGTATRSDMETHVIQPEAVGYETTESAYKHLVRPALKQLAEGNQFLSGPGERGRDWKWNHGSLDASEDGAEAVVSILGELETGEMIAFSPKGHAYQYQAEVLERDGTRVLVDTSPEPQWLSIENNTVVCESGVRVSSIRRLDASTESGVTEAEEAESFESVEEIVGETQPTQPEPEEPGEPEESEESDSDSESAPSPLVDRDGSRELVAGELTRLLDAGLSPAQALDYWATVSTDETFGGFTQSEWAEHRKRSHQAISDRVVKARETLTDNGGDTGAE